MAYRITSDQKKIAALKKKLEQLKAPIDRATAMQLGKALVDEMLDLISKGISTVEGTGRMPAYKAQAKSNALRKAGNKAGAKAAKTGYPYSVKYKYPDKRDRPVNLKLSGDFLKDLRFLMDSDRFGFFPKIGYGSSKSWDKELGHAEGYNGQPKRPTIPDNQQKFAQRIQRLISSIYKKRIRELASK